MLPLRMAVGHKKEYNLQAEADFCQGGPATESNLIRVVINTKQ